MSCRADFINQQLYLIDHAYAGEDSKKYNKMRTSPFVFYRGSAQLFYADLSVGNLKMPEGFLDTPLTTVMGDCHTSNFGFFTEEGSHGDEVVFSLNDFDDACIGYAYWDIVRYLTSLSLAADHGQGLASARYSEDKDFSNKRAVCDKQLEQAINAFLDNYLLILDQGLIRKPTQPNFLDTTFGDFATPSPLVKRYKKAKSIALGGELFLTKSSLAKAVDLTTFPLKFVKKEDKFTRDGINTEQLIHHFQAYFYDHILDIVKRVNSGTGSVNMDRYYLLVGPKNIKDTCLIPSCHVVEVKQQRTAAPLYYFSDLHHQNHLNPAHLTVKCQRRMLRKQDYCLDDSYFEEAHWLIRSRHHAKVGIDPHHITLGKINTEQGGFAFYAGACGQALARAHCRGDKSSLNFEQSNLAAINQHRQELIDISMDYALGVKKDYEWFCEQY